MNVTWQGLSATRARATRLTLALLLSVSLAGCYVLHLAHGQLELINAQKPLPAAIRDETDLTRKQLLAEVPLITDFAEHVLGMNKSESYVGYYPLERDWLTLVLSAAPRDRLVPHTRWYPVAGRVPYRSFFDETRAKRAQRELEQDGYDTYLHHSPAYSTLGFFRDPVTTPMLERRLPCPAPADPTQLDACRIAGLAETLIHELTHQHLYVQGETNFNEQLASFVGRTGAIEYLVSRGLYDEALRARLQIAFARQQRFEEEVASVVRELSALYASDAVLSTKLAEREALFARIAQLGLSTFPESTREDWQPMNNARVLQYVRYVRRADTMDKLWQKASGRWPRFWQLVQRHAQGRR
jgi:predicted aminopeptidase